jgi:pimeloyl-ACP methyl ester carboxylesterase
MAAVTYRTVEVDGLPIFSREAGAAVAPPLLLLDGFPSASHMFRAFIPRLADRCHVLAPDLPGFGQSGMPPRPAFRYTFDNLARVIDRLTQVVGLERFAVSVFDDGAPMGFRLAMRHPERITGIVSQNGNAYEEGLSDRLVTDAASCCLLGYAGATYRMDTMMAKIDGVVGIRRIGQHCPNTTPTFRYQGKMV